MDSRSVAVAVAIVVEDSREWRGRMKMRYYLWREEKENKVRSVCDGREDGVVMLTEIDTKTKTPV